MHPQERTYMGHYINIQSHFEPHYAKYVMHRQKEEGEGAMC